MIILASQSAIRQQILQSAGLQFVARSPDYDEQTAKDALKGCSPKTLARELAAGKALTFAAKHPDDYVIGADQVLELQGQVFGKPSNPTEAKKQLQSLRGKTHQLHSAVCVSHQDKVAWHITETAELTMRNFSDEFLDTYLVSEGDQVIRSVGGYKIEGQGLQLFDKINGDYFTILGLPLLPLFAYFRQAGVIPS